MARQTPCTVTRHQRHRNPARFLLVLQPLWQAAHFEPVGKFPSLHWWAIASESIRAGAGTETAVVHLQVMATFVMQCLCTRILQTGHVTRVRILTMTTKITILEVGSDSTHLHMIGLSSHTFECKHCKTWIASYSSKNTIDGRCCQD